MHSLLLTNENLQTRIKPLSKDPEYPHGELEPTPRKHVVPTYLPLDHLPPKIFRALARKIKVASLHAELYPSRIFLFSHQIFQIYTCTRTSKSTSKMTVRKVKPRNLPLRSAFTSAIITSSRVLMAIMKILNPFLET
jgi:hypothetical protein